MTKGATTCLSWHPCSGAYPLIASGDKYGAVALWAVNFDAARDGFELGVDDAGSKQSGSGSGGGGEGGGSEAAAAAGGSGCEAAPSASASASGSEDDEDAFDGILAFNPHENYISALRWVGYGGSAKLLSASYDGAARLLDLQKGEALGERRVQRRGGGGSAAHVPALLLCALASLHACLAADAPALPLHPGEFLLVPGLAALDAEWSAAEGDGDAHTLYLATPQGDGAVVDVRAGKVRWRCLRAAVWLVPVWRAPCHRLGAWKLGRASSRPLYVRTQAVATGLDLHDRKINTLALASDGLHMASSCSDGAIKVRRRSGKVLLRCCERPRA